MGLPPPPPQGILLRPSSSAIANSSTSTSTSTSNILLSASPAPLSRAEEDQLAASAFAPAPAPTQQHQAQTPSGAGAGAGSGSKFSTLIHKLGRRTNSASQHKQHAAASSEADAAVDRTASTADASNTTASSAPAPAPAPGASTTDDHLHNHHHHSSSSNKKNKHSNNKSRNGSGKHTPTVEGDYGQFLAAAELRAALEREQAKAAKRSEKEREKDSKKHSKNAKHEQQQQHSAQTSAAQDYAPPMKPSRSLPGAFTSLSRASSARSDRRTSGTNTPRDRKRRGSSSNAHDLKPPNPCGMPIYDSSDEEENQDDDDDDDEHAVEDGEEDDDDDDEHDAGGDRHHHRSHHHHHHGDRHDAKRSSGISLGRRKPFFSRARSSDSTPRALSRRSSVSSSASSEHSIMRASYPLDLAAINTEELRSAAAAAATDARHSKGPRPGPGPGAAKESDTEGEADISSTRSIKSWRSDPSGSSISGTLSDANVVLSRPLLELEEFELDNFIKNFSRHTKEVRVPFAPTAARRMPQWSDFRVPANEAELAAAEGRKVTVLTHVDRGLQAILNPTDEMAASTAAASAAAAAIRATHEGAPSAPVSQQPAGASSKKKKDTSTHAGSAAIGADNRKTKPSLDRRPTSSAGPAHTPAATATAAASAPIANGLDPVPDSPHVKWAPATTDASMKRSSSTSVSDAPSSSSLALSGAGSTTTTAAAPPLALKRHSSLFHDLLHHHHGGQEGSKGAGAGARPGTSSSKAGPGSGPVSPAHSAANSPILSFAPLHPDLATSSASGGGGPPRSSGDGSDDAATLLDDGWEVVEGVAVKHEDGKALLGGMPLLKGSNSLPADGGGAAAAAAVARAYAAHGRGMVDDDQEVDAVAFVIAYILALVERYAPEELDNGPDDRYREGKLRSHLERLYIIAPFWERFLLGVRSLYRWEQPRRTGAAAMIYFVLWYTDLIPTAFMLSLMYYILQFRFFPPSESYLHEQVRKRMARGIEADKFSEQLRRRSRLDLLDLYKRWIERFGVATQIAAGDIADFHEKVKNLILWRNPTATWRTFSLLCIATLFVTFAPAHYVWKTAFFFLGLNFFILLPLQSHYPRYRRPLSPIWWALWGSPTDFVWGSKILRERHARMHGEQWTSLPGTRASKEGGKLHLGLYHGLFHSRKTGRNASTNVGAGDAAGQGVGTGAGAGAGAGGALDALGLGGSNGTAHAGASGPGGAAALDPDSDEARKELLAEQLKEAQRGKKLASFFCQHRTVPGHLHVTTKMVYFVALHSTRPTNSRKTCKTELGEIAGLVKTNNFRLLGIHGLKVRKRDGKSMHFTNMSHRDDAFNLILSVTGSGGYRYLIQRHG
ncbi:hypothetical protein OC842_000693 [Tilletia horrida]|uniref:Uncharacterized protein n=1 Tax=Tilletia horrida TaxID=155126 RepID=A0AAN6GGF6_9BASI|nr:hypothetical protein OC842_000693 [Tilletia horrida]